MFIPTALTTTSRCPSNEKTSRLARRKGGGGHSVHGSESSDSESPSSDSPSTSESESEPSTAKGASHVPPALVNSAAGRSFAVSSGSALAYAGGGGAIFTLGADTPFAGRQAGGGERSEVYGTSRYGSGYPYGATGSYITDRPFPYVFYPIPIAPYDYYGSDPYMNINDTQRPGGALAEALIQPANNTLGLTFRIVGDNASVSAVYAALVANCSAANTSTAIAPFVPSLTAYPFPEQVVQWYRASTFALSLDTYNNSAALLASMPPSDSSPAPPQSADTPLPAGLNTTFLQCVNATIGASVPLVDPPPGHHLSGIEVASVVVGSVAVAFFAFYIALDVIDWWRRGRAERKEAREREQKI